MGKAICTPVMEWAYGFCVYAYISGQFKESQGRCQNTELELDPESYKIRNAFYAADGRRHQLGMRRLILKHLELRVVWSGLY